nr:hypothetical protein [Aeromonas caviae]
MKEVLPLLQQSRWHRKVRYGYARGGEARNYVNNVRQYYQSLLWLDNEQQKAHRREELDEDDSSESGRAGTASGHHRRSGQQIITPLQPRRGGGVCFPALFSVTILGIRGALERTYCNVFIALQFLPRGPFRPHARPGGETGCEHAEEPCWPEKTKCAWSPRRKLKLARHETQDLHRNRLLHAADSGAHSINPASRPRFFYALSGCASTQNGGVWRPGLLQWLQK